MNNNQKGWIKLHRKIFETKGYHAEPFCRTMAWIDLLLLANHSENFFYVRNNPVDVRRGQCAYASESLGTRWQWSRGKVRNFLKQLEKSGQIIQHKSTVITVITIVNYDLYQSSEPTENTTGRASRKLHPDLQDDTNKNEKNKKNEKNDNKAGQPDNFLMTGCVPFDGFWSLYDKKVGNKEAIERLWFALSNEEQTEVMQYIPRYIHAQPDKTYRKNPARFLSERSWLDEILHQENTSAERIEEAKLQDERWAHNQW